MEIIRINFQKQNTISYGFRETPSEEEAGEIVEELLLAKSLEKTIKAFEGQDARPVIIVSFYISENVTEKKLAIKMCHWVTGVLNKNMPRTLEVAFVFPALYVLKDLDKNENVLSAFLTIAESKVMIESKVSISKELFKRIWRM